MKPKIAITVAPERIGDTGYWQPYIDAVTQAGGEAQLISDASAPDQIERLLAGFDGLLVPGGGDVEPERYGARTSQTLSNVSPGRDDLEIYATQIAKRTNLPTLGICRGIQVMNVALGGTLYVDIGEEFQAAGAPALEHRQQDARHEPTHPVDLAAGSKIAAILGTTSVPTNSTHHQGLRRVAHDLLRVGTTRDGLVEAVELRDDGHPFFVGVQWHPEAMIGRDEPSRRLFKAFVECAAARANQKAEH